MNKLVQPWQDFIRKQRLLLVTSVNDELTDLFTNLIPLNVLLFSTDIIVFNLLDKQNEHIQIQFRPIRKEVNTRVFQRKECLIHSVGTKPEILYKKTLLSPDETYVLRKLFDDCHQWCQQHV